MRSPISPMHPIIRIRPIFFRALAPNAFVFVILSLIELFGCTPDLQAVSVPFEEFSGPTMGSYYAIKVVGGPQQDTIDLAQQRVQETLDRIDNMMSTYKPDSELSRFNRH